MNELKKIQGILMTRLERLDDDYYMKDNLKDEVMRSNATTNAALAYLKTENLKLRIKGLSHEERKAIKKFTD